MKKKNYMEMIGILSLSLLLTTPLAVSGCLPEMVKKFSTYPRSSVEVLLSLPAFAMMVMIALSPIISKYMKERTMVISGLLLLGVAGMIPAFFTSYTIIFISRIVLGLGIGLVNTNAVNLIGQRFSGNLQQKLQGIRCSMETLGQAVLTLVAGQLLRFSWNSAFLIYGTAFLILAMYLAFVPQIEIDATYVVDTRQNSEKISLHNWKTIILSTLFGCLMVSSSVMISLRLPSYVVESGLGNAIHGSTILSIATLGGFLGGMFFGYLAKQLKHNLLPISLSMVAVGLILLIFSDNLIIATCGASICTFFITNCVSYMLGNLPEQLPTEILGTANAAVLVGCNLGAFLAPFFLQAANLVYSGPTTGFWAYAIVALGLAVGILAHSGFIKRK